MQTYLDTSNTIHLYVDYPYTYVHFPLVLGVSDSSRLLQWREIVSVASYACVMPVALSQASSNSLYYLAMEYVDRSALKNVLDRIQEEHDSSCLSVLLTETSDSLLTLGFALNRQPCKVGIFALDHHAASLLPADLLNDLRPCKVYGDGNCLFEVLLFLCCGDESWHVEFRIACLAELWPHWKWYAESFCALAKSVEEEQPNLRVVSLLSSTLSDDANVLFISQRHACVTTEEAFGNAIRRQAIHNTKSGVYASFLHIAAMASVLGGKVKSVYPNKNDGIRSFMNTGFSPRVEASHNVQAAGTQQTLSIMWSRSSLCQTVQWSPNHFVPLIEPTHIPTNVACDNSRFQLVENSSRKQSTLWDFTKVALAKKRKIIGDEVNGSRKACCNYPPIPVSTQQNDSISDGTCLMSSDRNTQSSVASTTLQLPSRQKTASSS